MSPTEETQLREHCATLGIGTDVTLESLERIYLQKSYALIRGGASEADREKLKAAKQALTALLQGEQARQQPMPQPREARPPIEPELIFEPEKDKSIYDPTSFDSALVNLLAPPIVGGLGIVATFSPFQTFLVAFQIWVHEFGHATVAWLTGHRALPLPIGWTNAESEKSFFVYFGILFLLGILFAAGWKERKPWAMILAVLVAVAQFYMTCLLPNETARMWRAFCGIGGEFYLAALMLVLFYVELPEKFRWGLCRYFFLFICAGSFFRIFQFWKLVKRGLEGVPLGSMVNGEEDAGGDMNILLEDFSWTNRQIIRTYNTLADTCLLILIIVYLFYVLRVDRLLARLWQRIRGHAA